LDLLHLVHSLSTRDYRQYSAIAILHTFQFTVAHALGFSVFTSHILATDSITVSLSLQITHEVFFAQPKSFLPLFCNCQCRRLDSIQFLCSWQAGVSKLDSTRLLLPASELFLMTTLHDHAENTASIVKEACLLIRCIATDVLLLRAFSSAGM
jgi:hypothetical protein